MPCLRPSFVPYLFASMVLASGCPDEADRPEGPASNPALPEKPGSPPVGAGAGVEPGAAPKHAEAPRGGSATEAKGSPAGSEEKEGHTFVKLGKVTVPLPAGWRIKQQRSPPKHFLHVTPSPEATCDIGLLEGHGRPEEAERYLSAANSAYKGKVTRNDDLEVGGETFQGIHIAQPKALAEAGEATVDVYVAILGEDLLGLSFTSFGPGPGRAACEEAFGEIVETLK